MSKSIVTSLERKTYVLNLKGEALCDINGYPIRKFQCLVFNGEEFTIQGISKLKKDTLVVRDTYGENVYKVRNSKCLIFRPFVEVCTLL